jgi:hypothetical protein
MSAEYLIVANSWAAKLAVLAELTPKQIGLIIVIGLGLIFALIALAVILNFGGLWLRAYTSNAHVSFFDLIGMKLRQVNASTIVDGKIMAMQAGVGTDPETGITTRRLEAHYLAGGDVPRVINALIAAHKARIDLDWNVAQAIDLAGRDVLEAVRTSVYPKVIDCPDPAKSGRPTLSAVARNGVELGEIVCVVDDRRGHRHDDQVDLIERSTCHNEPPPMPWRGSCLESGRETSLQVRQGDVVARGSRTTVGDDAGPLPVRVAE